MSTMTGLTLVCARLNHREGAAALYETFSRHPEGNANAGDAQSYGPVAGYLGQLATVLQRWDDAERYFQAAIALDEQMGHQPDLARTQVNYARVLLRRNSPGDRDRGVALLQEALSFAEETGMGQVQGDTERLLSS